VRPERESLAERLERERLEQERAYRERRARVERERAERERAERERVERRRREHAERLRREQEFLRRRGQLPATPRKAVAPPPAKPSPQPQRATASRTRPRPSFEPPAYVPQVAPHVEGPVRKRARAAENRRRAAARRRGLFWPTAKAGLAITVVVALGAGLGSLLGLPLPGLDARSGDQSLLNSASAFGLDAGTPPGLSPGYVFPIEGPYDFGDAQARFGASRYGHIHEGQDLFAKSGTPEVAVSDGVVVDGEAENGRYSGGRGNYLVIYRPEDDRSFVYMHMLKPPTLRIGDHVHAGQVIGQLGCSGSCEGPHLHFEIRVGKATLRSDTKPIDPLPYLRQWPQPVPG
jgi:murein DD-endopeptidase MepM/ murein hydrolase activator NlpD